MVIDGRDRSACADFVLEQINHGLYKKGAIVIFDDSQRKWYEEAVDRLAEVSSIHKCFSGPVNSQLDKTTSIFTLR